MFNKKLKQKLELFQAQNKVLRNELDALLQEKSDLIAKNEKLNKSVKYLRRELLKHKSKNLKNKDKML